MMLNLDIVKKKLKEEFIWLKENYPLDGFKDIHLKIYNFKDYEKEFENDSDCEESKPELEAFIIDEITEGKVEFLIFLVLTDNHVLDEIDNLFLNKDNIEEENLIYLMLYHEYGHLIHLHKTFKKSGLRFLKDELNNMSEDVEKLVLEKDKGEITQKEMDIMYRELWFEKEADNFAYQIYKKRKKEINK